MNVKNGKVFHIIRNVLNHHTHYRLINQIFAPDECFVRRKLEKKNDSGMKSHVFRLLRGGLKNQPGCREEISKP